MKVLEKGRAQQGWSGEFTCTGQGHAGGGCGAKLLVSKGDFKRNSWTEIDGSRDSCTHFQCPCCGVLTDVKVQFYVPSD